MPSVSPPSQITCVAATDPPLLSMKVFAAAALAARATRYVLVGFQPPAVVRPIPETPPPTIKAHLPVNSKYLSAKAGQADPVADTLPAELTAQCLVGSASGLIMPSWYSTPSPHVTATDVATSPCPVALDCPAMAKMSYVCR